MNSSPFNKNISAFLWAIRCCEGTNSTDGYRMLFGGGLFDGFEEHPNILVEKSGYKSTAAGAYQILYDTWNTVIQPNINLPDFSPESQDAAAVFLIKNRGALEDVKEGRIEEAVNKCNKEWASLPGSPYGQPVYEMEYFKRFYEEAKYDDSNPIERIKEIPDVKVSGKFKITGRKLKKVDGSDKTIAELAIPDKTFWDHVGETLKGKNKTGKTIYGILTAGVSLLTGINIESITQTITEPTTMDFLTDINIWGIIGGLLAIAFGYLKTLTGAKLDAVIDDAESGTQMFLKFKSKESDGGTKVTESEKDLLIEHFAEIFEKQAKKSL